MNLDFKKALDVLESEVHEARALEPRGPWADRARALSEACKSANKTMIAAYGTALLAKATDQRVNVFALQAGAGEGGYSARNLCKEVLAANAPRLTIDLGVTGREPLNNQPFFGKALISPALTTKKSAQAPLKILLEALEALNKVSTAREAREALRAFLQIRERKRVPIQAAEGEGDSLEESDLCDLIKGFVRQDSENGKRAQAVAAGLFDAMVGVERVKVGRINDPGRSNPGDIGIWKDTEETQLDRAFEVRDKPVTDKDLKNLVEKARTAGVTKVAMLAAATDQPSLNIAQEIRWAGARNIRLGVYIGWERIVAETLFWSDFPALVVGHAYRAILDRLNELEISDQGIDLWRSAVSKG